MDEDNTGRFLAWRTMKPERAHFLESESVVPVGKADQYRFLVLLVGGPASERGWMCGVTLIIIAEPGPPYKKTPNLECKLSKTGGASSSIRQVLGRSSKQEEPRQVLM